jgi:SAM-dependent methyltransferase
MRLEHLKYLVCPRCHGDLGFSGDSQRERDQVIEGNLACCRCRQRFPIIGGVPRFVENESYSSSFGFEWIRHATTQYDSHNGTKISETRFFGETKWPRDLSGQTVLEAGCGSGRFTEQAALTGAMVISFDLSRAVEVNEKYNGHRKNVLIIQADLFNLPLRTDSFDKVFCFGVLQHTPSVEGALFALVDYLKPGGIIAVDVYYRVWWRRLVETKYWVRPITNKLKPMTLYKLCRWWVRFLWPLATCLRSIPQGFRLSRFLLVADHGPAVPIPDQMRREWAVLDTFDWLSPAYDHPQSLVGFRGMFDRAPLEEVEVVRGQNGIEGRGIKIGP